jgi:hypothetical protein
MKKGDLLICVANGHDNPDWIGILPVIGEYYVCREAFTVELFGVTFGACQVEEIINPKDSEGREYVHDQKWYKVIDEEMNISIEEILSEAIVA